MPKSPQALGRFCATGLVLLFELPQYHPMASRLASYAQSVLEISPLAKAVVLPALAAGCTGMILASAQVFPKHWRRVYDAVRSGQLYVAREAQFKVYVIMALVACV